MYNYRRGPNLCRTQYTLHSIDFLHLDYLSTSCVRDIATSKVMFKHQQIVKKTLILKWRRNQSTCDTARSQISSLRSNATSVPPTRISQHFNDLKPTCLPPTVRASTTTMFRGRTKGRVRARGSYGSTHKVPLKGLFSDGTWKCNCDPRLPAQQFQTKNGGKNHGRWCTLFLSRHQQSIYFVRRYISALQLIIRS